MLNFVLLFAGEKVNTVNVKGDNFETFSLGNFSSRLVHEWNSARQISFNVCICYKNIKENSGSRLFLSQLELL